MKETHESWCESSVLDSSRMISPASERVEPASTGVARVVDGWKVFYCLFLTEMRKNSIGG